MTCTQVWMLAVIRIRYWLERVGYAIRPYDMLADARRWFWQPRQPCGRMVAVRMAVAHKPLLPDCCGDPTNRDGGAHPWEFVGEDTVIHYQCPVCGATDED